jgi:hypothetical protein
LISLDANGNTLSDPSGKSYSWDFENRLTQAVVPGSSGGTTTFKYDPRVAQPLKSSAQNMRRVPRPCVFCKGGYALLV